MCKKLVVVLAVLMLASTSFAADYILGNWESGTDGWGKWDSGTNTVIASTAFEAPNYDYGVTLGDASMKVVQNGWAQAVAIDLNADQRAAIAANNQFKIDISSGLGTTGGRLIVEGITLNAGSGFGWTSISSGQTYMDCWAGAPSRTMNVTASYNTSIFGGVAPSYAQIIITLNGYGGQTDFYLDKARLVPEPATMALLGLGGLTLLRRKK